MWIAQHLQPFQTLSKSDLFFFSLSLPTVLPSSSPPGWAHREWMYGRFDVEDHRLRPGERVAQDHQDEHGRHLRLDGPWGHQVLHLLQGQRRLEVSAWVCERMQKPNPGLLHRSALMAFMFSKACCDLHHFCEWGIWTAPYRNCFRSLAVCTLNMKLGPSKLRTLSLQH